MYILGINIGRNTSAALVRDGNIVCASEEARWNGIHGTNAFPLMSIRYCLEDAGVSMQDVDAFTFSYDYGNHLWDTVLVGLRYFPKSVEALVHHTPYMRRAGQFIRLTSQHFGVREETIRQKCHCIEHHLSHAASAYFRSPFNSAAVLSMDGCGEIDTVLFSRARGSVIKKIQSVKFPYSLGFLYNTFTQYLGFPIDQGEGSVMALSARGKPMYASVLQSIVRPTNDGTFTMDMSFFRYHYTANKRAPFYSKKFIDAFGPPRQPADPITARHAHVAASLQKTIEDIGVHMATRLRTVTGGTNLCLSGGVALNSTMNARIRRRVGFQRVYVDPVPSDAGTAVGSALYYYHCVRGYGRRRPIQARHMKKSSHL